MQLNDGSSPCDCSSSHVVIMFGRSSRLFCRSWVSFAAAKRVQFNGNQVWRCLSEPVLKQGVNGCLYPNSNWSTPCCCSLWCSQLFHSSPAGRGLEEFFPKTDDIIEEGEQTGNRWQARILRQKSNEDLHKLWYVLLKERNMLLTLKHEARRAGFIMPAPERMWKVRKSMAKIKLVIGERKRAIEEAKRILEGKPPVVKEKSAKKNYKRTRKFRNFRKRVVIKNHTVNTTQETKNDSVAA